MFGCLMASSNVASVRLVLLVEHWSLGNAKNHDFCHQNEGTVVRETTPPTNIKENWFSYFILKFLVFRKRFSFQNLDYCECLDFYSFFSTLWN